MNEKTPDKPNEETPSTEKKYDITVVPVDSIAREKFLQYLPKP